MDELDEPEAKASLIWIIGEYASKIDNADELLAIFVDSFTEEAYPVRDSVILRVHPRLTVGLLPPGAITDTYSCCEIIHEET